MGRLNVFAAPILSGSDVRLIYVRKEIIMQSNITSSDETTLELYKKALVSAFNLRLQEYYNRSDNNPYREHNHVKAWDVLKDAANTGSSAAGAGSQIPIVGTLIGGAGGVAYSFFSSLKKEVNFRQQNNKIDNAHVILQFFDYYKKNDEHFINQELLQDIAAEIIKQRSEILLRLVPSTYNIEAVGDFITVNGLAAIKRCKFAVTSKVEMIVDGIQMLYSDKLASENLKTKDGHHINLEEIAKTAVVVSSYGQSSALSH